MAYKKIQIVDESDNFIKNVWYDEAVANGWLRRGSRVFVFDIEGNVLLQRRSTHISQPLKLDNSAAGHVDEGETYEQAAVRELKEELGLEASNLKLVEASFRTERFFNSLYKLVIDRNVPLQIDPHEVAEVVWFTPAEVDTLLLEKPTECTDSLREIWSTFRGKLIS